MANLPDIFNRPLKQFPNLISNFLSNPWPNLFEDDVAGAGGVQIYEEGNELHVEMPLPGLDSKDIDISINKGVLIVRGECKEEKTDEEKDKRKFYSSSKRRYSYSVALPTQVDEKQEPEAFYNDGILSLSFKLAPKEDMKKVNIKPGNKKAR